MSLSFPLKLEFKFSLFTTLKVFDAQDRLIALVKEKKFSIRDEVRVYSDESRQVQTHSIKAQGLLAGALDWKARRMILRQDGQPVGAVQAQGLRTLWAAGYELLDAHEQPRFSIRDDHPWLGLIENAVDALPLIGDLVGIVFDYLVNPTYTVSDTAGQAVYKVHKKRSFFSRRFTVEELRPSNAADDELVLLGLVQMVLRERQRG